LVGEDALARSQAGAYFQDAGETVKRSGYAGGYQPETVGETLKKSGYGGYDPYGASGTRSYDVNVGGGGQSGETVKRSGNVPTDVRASGTGQTSGIRILRKTQLEDARRLFDRFDSDRSGYIDDSELKILMEETYKILGVIKNVTNDEVQSYLDMVDTDKDGKISPQEYEAIIIRSLERIGIIFE